MLADFSTSPLSILPALVALGLAVITRRVILSLGFGILTGALLLNAFSVMDTLRYLGQLITGLFIEDGSINRWNLSIVMFLLLLGMITAMMTLSGGTLAFAEWARQRVKSKRGAKLLAAFLGVFIFVDDYFNSLAVGAISRPVTDRFQISRAKLAYILDSTAAPMCVIMPLSSWGAYIITIIGGILLTHNVQGYSPLSAFVTMIPMNFYAIFALLMVFAVSWFQIDIGAMRRIEMATAEPSGLDPAIAEEARQLDSELDIAQSDNGTVLHLIVPIVTLIVSTFGWMIYSGAAALSADGKGFSLLGAFENTDVGMSLLFGSTMSFIVALCLVVRQKLPANQVGSAIFSGAKSMFGAVFILFFAWSIGSVIGEMQTGKYLSSLLSGNLPVQLLPVLLFLLSALMAFSTGTSWGTFGIMLPIAGDFAAAADITMMLPMLAAVLAGSVFGDHCSPISDTTILSSTGARCNHIDHVTTQLPYAVIGAIISAISFVMLGYTGSLLASLLAGLFVFIGICSALRYLACRPIKVI